MFRPRYSLRTLLIVVTFVALGCWLFVRHREFDRRAEYHAEVSRLAKWNAVTEYADTFWIVHVMQTTAERQPAAAERERLHNQRQALSAYHLQLSKKYQRAARQPWLPIEVDPPAPLP